MPIPPQFLKGKKPANDDATEAVDNAAEDAAEGEPFTPKKKSAPPAKGGKGKADFKKKMLMAMAKKG